MLDSTLSETKISLPSSFGNEEETTTKTPTNTKIQRRKSAANGSVVTSSSYYHNNDRSLKYASGSVSRGSLSVGSGSKTRSTNTHNRAMEEHDAKSETVVRRLKMAILLFFTLTAVGVSTAFFVYRSHSKQNFEAAFRKKFRDEAYGMLASIGANLDSTLGATDAFAISMLAEARSTNQTWPFVTINNFAVQAGKLLTNARAVYSNTYHNVGADQRLQWEAYTATHSDWIDTSIAVQSRDPGYTGPAVTETFLKENYLGNYDLIHDYDEAVYGWGNSTDGVDHPGPFLATWQTTPVIPIDPLYNWDLLSNSPNVDTANATLKTHLVTISETYLINWPDDLEYEEYNEQEAKWFSNYLEPGVNAMSPIVDIYFPVIVDALDSVRHQPQASSSSSSTPGHNHGAAGDTNDTPTDTLGAYLALSIYWRDLLRDLLPSGSAGVIAVFKNPLNPPFAFEISGPVPRYLGVGHYNSTMGTDPDLNITTGLMDVWDYAIANTSYTGIPVNQDICPYTIEVYPAASARQKLFDQNESSSVYVVLILVLVVSIATIGFTFLFFFLYDRLVRNEIRAKINLLDAKRNFVRFVSHEVRTPLNTVTMGLTLIHQDFQRREKLLGEQEMASDSSSSNTAVVTEEDFLRWSSLTQEVSSNADVAVGVLNDLLNIDKIQMGGFKLHLEVLQIWQIVEQTTSEFTMMAAKQRTNLKLDLSRVLLAGGGTAATTKENIKEDDNDDIESSNSKSLSRIAASQLPKSILDQKLIGDEQRLRQVLRNLLSNAIKFSKNGQVAVRVSSHNSNAAHTTTKKDLFRMADGTRRGFSASGRIVIDVVDTGVGMTEAQLETVFDVGTQFHANKLQSGGGSGLGLAFAKAIAEQHGGSLRAYSDGKDKGTTFRLDLPLHHVNDAFDRAAKEKATIANAAATGSFSAASSSTTTSSSAASSKTKKIDPAKAAAVPRNENENENDSGPEDDEQLEPMNILVVDDAPMNRKLLVRLLESNGHTCGQAENGRDLIDTVRKDMGRYDCILVDYEMPVMNGPEACKGVREMGYTGFVVGVTGNLLPEDIGHFVDCGADAVLPKPFKYNDLERLLIEDGMFGLS